MPRDEAAPTTAPPQVLARPQVSLVGDIDKFTVERFLDQLHAAEKAGGDIAVEVTTLGGDPEMARRIVLETQYARKRVAGRLLFLGKSVVYSAGTTIMCGFEKEERWLAGDTMLMIHGRKLDKTVEISGPIRTSLPQLKALQAQIETGITFEDENFRRLIQGSDIDFEEICEKSLCNWYIPAEEAVKRGLAAGIWEPA
jgi:ATP-dependent protease ClpP protease subunit